MNYNKLNWCSGWRFHYPFGFTDFEVTQKASEMVEMNIVRTELWNYSCWWWRSTKMCGRELVRAAEDIACHWLTFIQSDRKRKSERREKERERFNGKKRSQNGIQIQWKTEHIVESVLRLHSNNTTNFIFITNKTNFYHYLAGVCSLKLAFLLLCHIPLPPNTFTHSLSLCTATRSIHIRSSFAMQTNASDYWCAYFLNVWSRGFDTAITK